MKKVLIIIFFIIFSISIMQGCATKNVKEYLRIHIRANSNAEIDQAVKLKVKDEVVAFLSDKIDDCKNKEEAIQVLNDNKLEIKNVADKVLSLNGFTYKSNIRIVKEEFPSRTYGDLTLDSGVYDALIIELGEGVGDNWWCIVFPPLCFVSISNDNVEYRSFILDFIKNITRKLTMK